MVSFTTTIIVNRRIDARRISVYMFELVYIMLKLEECICNIGGVIFKIFAMNSIDIVDMVIEIIMCMIDRFWLGMIATKYENITNMPPI